MRKLLFAFLALPIMFVSCDFGGYQCQTQPDFVYRMLTINGDSLTVDELKAMRDTVHFGDTLDMFCSTLSQCNELLFWTHTFSTVDAEKIKYEFTEIDKSVLDLDKSNPTKGIYHFGSPCYGMGVKVKMIFAEPKDVVTTLDSVKLVVKAVNNAKEQQYTESGGYFRFVLKKRK